jgi:hypothetical protein
LNHSEIETVKSHNKVGLFSCLSLNNKSMQFISTTSHLEIGINTYLIVNVLLVMETGFRICDDRSHGLIDEIFSEIDSG